MIIVWSLGCEHSEGRRSIFLVMADLIDVALVAKGDLEAVAKVRDVTFLNLIKNLLLQGSLRWYSLNGKHLGSNYYKMALYVKPSKALLYD